MTLRTNGDSPLLTRADNEPIARLTSALNGLPIEGQYRNISQAQFVNHVVQLADALPEHQHAINLCDNRYLFLVSLCAVTVRERTNLLPPNKNPSTQAALSQRYDECVVLHDNATQLSAELNAFDVSALEWSLNDTPATLPSIAAEHLAVISFTSGSTGESKPNLKYWRTLLESSAINARYMLVDAQQNHNHVATVPGQHMWGFETSVLLALFANVTLVDARPFFPTDIIDLINRLPTPTTLISAPLHLKTLSSYLDSQDHSKRPKPLTLASMLCATAPLDPALAHKLETQFQCQLKEVYGCSEVGSMAVRNTAQQTLWQPFQGLQFERKAQTAAVSAPHLPEVIELEDQLNFTQDGLFELAGRATDLIKIAGKRGSLNEVNKVLNRFDGLIDGVVIFPPQRRNVPRLVALVILKEGVSRTSLRDFMTQHLDSAFVPRPILQVEQLPREENGKLSKKKVLDLYQRLVSA